MAISGVTDYTNTYVGDRTNGSRGYNNVAVFSSTVEKMASDQAAAAKYEKVFAEICDIKISDEGHRMYRENLSKLEKADSITAKEKSLDMEIFSKAVIDITGLTQLNFYSQFKKLNSKNHIDGGKCTGLDLAKNCFEIYTSMYNEIKQGYADGTREIWMVDQGAENGFRKATEDEELAALDSAYDFYAQVVDAYVNVGSKNSETIENAVNKLRADLENQKYVNRTQEESDQTIEDLYDRLMNAADAWKKGYSADAENSYLFDAILKNNIMMYTETVTI